MHFKKNLPLFFLYYYTKSDWFTGEQEDGTGSAQRWNWGVGRGDGEEVAQIMYTHVSTCKNDKIKFKK
jgi:hypothetical protein